MSQSQLRKKTGEPVDARGAVDGSACVMPRAYRVPVVDSTFKMLVDGTSRQTAVFDPIEENVVLVHSDQDIYIKAGTNPVANVPGAPSLGAPGAAGSLLLLAGNQVPVVVGPGEKLAFVAAGPTATVTYSDMKD